MLVFVLQTLVAFFFFCQTIVTYKTSPSRQDLPQIRAKSLIILITTNNLRTNSVLSLYRTANKKINFLHQVYFQETQKMRTVLKDRHLSVKIIYPLNPLNIFRELFPPSLAQILCLKSSFIFADQKEHVSIFMWHKGEVPLQSTKSIRFCSLLLYSPSSSFFPSSCIYSLEHRFNIFVPVSRVFLWQRYSTTYMPGTCTMALELFSVFPCGQKHFQKRSCFHKEKYFFTKTVSPCGWAPVISPSFAVMALEDDVTVHFSFWKQAFLKSK